MSQNLEINKISNFTILKQKPIELIKIKKICDHSHNHCHEICQNSKNILDKITQEYFDEFFELIKSNKYNNSCLSLYSNKNYNELIEFIIKCSEFLKIPSWDPIILLFTDEKINKIIINQKKIIPNFIINILNKDILFSNYNSKSNLITALITHPIKIKSFETVLMSIELSNFSIFLNKMSNTNLVSIDNLIVKYINYQKQNLKLDMNKEIGIKIINNFINKPVIIKNIYRIISNSLNKNQKIDIFNKSISSYDKDLIFLILEDKDIIPDINTINKLVEKNYVRPEGSFNSKLVAEIIDLLCEYGLIITKQIVSKLLDHGCYINNLEKHGIEIDSELLGKCANHSYYPYKFDIKPSTDILKKECSKNSNFETIKKLKEFGGIYTTECLEEACGVNKNGKIIKYLINDCGVLVSDKCLEKFQETYKIEALDILMKKYKIQNPESSISDQNKSRTVELDVNSIMTVTPKDVKIIKDDNLIEYDIKNKIINFFELKKKSIKYIELNLIFLKYLIKNKLVIGNYFIINEKLSSLLKIDYCTIMHMDQIHNILTYFIDIKN